MCSGQLATARRLLERTPAIASESIHTACAAADADAVEAWLRRDPTCVSQRRWEAGWTPILFLCASPMHAVDPQHAAASLRCAHLLLDAGADPNAFTLSDPANPQAKLPALYRACVSNNAPVVRLLLERGADVNDGESVYHAAQLNHRECLELLRTHGAEISASHPVWNNTPLYFLAGDGSTRAREGMRWLLEQGANPDVPSGPQRETPLHAAVLHGHPAIVSLLLDHGATPDSPRGDGRTAWVLALRNGRDEIARRLQAAGAKPVALTPVDNLLSTCMRGDESTARELATTDLMTSMTAEDRAALIAAVSDDRLAAVRTMIGIGFDPRWEGPHGGTALHWAAWRGRTDMVRLLLERGAPVNVRDSEYGSSPIAWAAHGSKYCRGAGNEDYRAIVDTLIDAGATYDAATNRWNEPPQGMASRPVRGRLIERGFVPLTSMGRRRMRSPRGRER